MERSGSPNAGEVQMDDAYIEIPDTGEVVDIASNATTPEALRRAAAYLRQQSEKPPDPRFSRFATEPETQTAPAPSFEDLIGHRRIDDVVDYEARRTARARAEIMVAIAAEEEQARQAKETQRAKTRAAVAGTGLGKLLRI
jgi:hypothetical protein